MALLTKLFGKQDIADSRQLKAAIEHAVSAVQPLLIQASGYPDAYLKPVSVALEYAGHLAHSLPGPIPVDREAYAQNAFVHTLFPDINAISDAVTSSLSVQEYLRGSESRREFYALMGMRRIDKKFFGVELAGSTLQRDVAQQATYFISHTIVDPAPDETFVRNNIARRFFHKLVDKVKVRIELRRKSKEALIAERNELMQRLRFVSNIERAVIEERLGKLADELEAIVNSLELDHFLEDFETVLLHPEKHLHLNQSAITLDNMGIRRNTEDIEQGKEFNVSELIGYDRRDWTVTIVRYTNVQYETFAEKLDQAYRYLSL